MEVAQKMQRYLRVEDAGRAEDAGRGRCKSRRRCRSRAEDGGLAEKTVVTMRGEYPESGSKRKVMSNLTYGSEMEL